MRLFASIFLDFQFPNAATCFYLSLVLAVALFIRFSRLLHIRNWDVLAIFLLVPGLLLRQEAIPAPSDGVAKLPANGTESPLPRSTTSSSVWFGYLALLCAAGYFFARCLLDLALVRRPTLSPNLTGGGLVWLGVALFACLVAVALRRIVLPGAALRPGIDNLVELVVVRRSIAVACHLSIILALVYIGWRHFQDAHLGVAAATFYLLLPYNWLPMPFAGSINNGAEPGMLFEQVHQVVPMAFVLWAIATYNKPTLAGIFLGLAAGSIYFPAFLFPAWLSFYWRRGAGRFATAFVLAAVLGLAVTALVYWAGGPVADELQATLNVFDWQQWKMPSTEGIWTGVHWAYRIPVFIAYLAFLVGTLFWPSPKNLAHLLAISAAILIGIQFWFADRGGLYVLWYVPLMLLIMFRPNLSDRYPPSIQPETDWVRRFRSRLVRLIRRSVKVPEPAMPIEQ
jgi:hypothetical protein